MKMKGDVEYAMTVSGFNWPTRYILPDLFKKLCITKTIRIHTKCGK